MAVSFKNIREEFSYVKNDKSVLNDSIQENIFLSALVRSTFFYAASYQSTDSMGKKFDSFD